MGCGFRHKVTDRPEALPVVRGKSSDEGDGESVFTVLWMPNLAFSFPSLHGETHCKAPGLVMRSQLCLNRPSGWCAASRPVGPPSECEGSMASGKPCSVAV